MKSTMTLPPNILDPAIAACRPVLCRCHDHWQHFVGFVFENTAVMAGVFQRMGLSAAAAMQAASTFIVWYRLVAVLFCLF